MSKRIVKIPFKTGTISRRAYERAVKLVLESKGPIVVETAPKKVLNIRRLIKAEESKS